MKRKYSCIILVLSGPPCNHAYKPPPAHCATAPPHGPAAHGTSLHRGHPDLSPTAAPAEAGAQPDRHRAVLVRGRNGPLVRGSRQLPPVRLPPGQRQLKQCFTAALEEDRGGEGPPTAYGLHTHPVPVWLHLPLCSASQRHPWPLWLLL